MLRFLQIGPRDHHLLASHVQSSLHNIVQIVLVSMLAMVHASKDRISQVDANLLASVPSTKPKEPATHAHLHTSGAHAEPFCLSQMKCRDDPRTKIYRGISE